MISGSEIFVVLFVAFLLFGTKRLPEIAKGLGKAMREFNRIKNDIKTEINKDDIGIKEEIKELKDAAGNISKEVDNESEIVKKIIKTKEV